MILGAPKTPKLPAPVATAAPGIITGDTVAAREEQKRLALRRGILSTIRNVGGLAGVGQTTAQVAQPTLIGQKRLLGQ